MASEEAEAEQRGAQQRQRTGLGDVKTGEEERIDQPGCIDASRVDIAQPGEDIVERIADRCQEEVVAEFAVGVGPPGSLEECRAA